ncbi:sugar phosphate nucleotidyltransferase [Clostridium sp.]|uniref:sugar phosphate nucleotidyltransferase n=1 Tax=Clostridium sp. TaxID=1506 RepID=UPI002FC5BB83
MNAIILAAGLGSRLRPLTLTTPKPLLKIKGISLIENQIKILKQNEIQDIIVVVGYKKEKFKYLEEKYGVRLVYNERFSVCNNIYSMYKVIDEFGDSFVLDGDIFINNNSLIKYEGNKSAYFACYRESYINEWKLIFDLNNKVQNIEIGNGSGYILSGVSFWCQKDSIILREKIKNRVENGLYKDLYWDDIVRENIGILDIKINKIQSGELIEFDTLDDFEQFTKVYMNKA